MEGEFHLTRRTLLAGSAMTFVMTLPAGAFAQRRDRSLPILVQISWAETQVSAARRNRTIERLFSALDQLGTGAGQAWVMHYA